MNVNSLADAAVTIATRGASEYLTRNNLKADPKALMECIKSHCKINLQAALHDAKEAFACHMEQIGVQTFAASMILAGTEAAKESGFPIGGVK